MTPIELLIGLAKAVLTSPKIPTEDRDTWQVTIKMTSDSSSVICKAVDVLEGDLI